MDGVTPSYLPARGRGRGRGGRGQPGQRSPQHEASRSPPGGSTWAQQVMNSGVVRNVGGSPRHGAGPTRIDPDEDNVMNKFEDAASRHQRAAQRHLGSQGDEYESSEDEDDLDDEKILNSVLKTFSGTSAEMGPSDLGRTEEYLTNSVKSKANVCLICIETIKRTEAIWSCSGCYTMFHIGCIQKWVKDGVYQQSLETDEDLRGQDLPWNCPKCRHEYKQSQCPTKYVCFCGKERDPPADPWLVPHSCGQVCGRALKPQCGHSCLLLCHPGPCPPCPKTVQAACYCGQRSPQVRRCGTQKWSCCQPCRKPLSCGHHNCKTLCHQGECPPCPERSTQSCQCGREKTLRPCAQPDWQCTQVCGAALSCGQHSCEKVCHGGPCGECPRAGQRSCPCGKTEFELPCTEDVPTCVDTCDKTLQCSTHRCPQRCHYGECGACREMTRKRCKCGKKEKEVQCYKDYQCETKCTNIKDCGKHSCKRKCCDGSCPPCDQACGKMLGCRNHKCSSRCHKGRCYPCPLTVGISCNCGGTTITVPCGREKVTKPPRCNKRCSKPADCHHAERTAHRCHFGYCPPCRHMCCKPLEPCLHKCPVPCHTAVLTRVQQKVQRAGPWEALPESQIQLINHPCPPCMIPTQVSCLGQHEIITMPCSGVRVASCHRPCGRLLACTNHTCSLECHEVKGAIDDQTAGATCMRCEEMCSRSRPEGCTHHCLLECHEGLCQECTQMIRMRCHCKQLLLHIECDQWTHAHDTERERQQSCHSKCPKTLDCGHQCKAICHAGKCPNPDRCVEKVNQRCKCRYKKRSYLCNEVQAGYGAVECDEGCLQHKEKQKQEKENKKEEAIKVAKLQEEQEIAEFKRKMEPRKRKPRKPRQEQVEPSFLQKHGKFIVGPLLAILLSCFVYYLFNVS